MNNGYLALDIDGTITDDDYTVPKNVVTYLKSLYQKGWKLAIVTGRSHTFAKPIFQCFDFPFLASLQNGSAILEMPNEKIIKTSYMQANLLLDVEKACEGKEIFFAGYTGVENNDICFWKRNDNPFVKELADDISIRQKKNHMIVEKLPVEGIEHISMIKCIAYRQDLLNLLEDLKNMNGEFDHCMIRNPFDERFDVLLLTKKNTTKGSLVDFIFEKNNDHFVIAAGNDDNDVSLLKNADVKIAMEDSPEHLLKMADYVAPHAKNEGIISALKQVMTKLEGK